MEGVRSGRTDLLSKAITLVESTKPDDRRIANDLVQACTAPCGNSLRIAITGIPGVGKSTFINEIGKLFIKRGMKVAVLAIDPSSERSKGSILGDKTRMVDLVASDQAFIRPSPTSGTLGGVARSTYSSILLCEAAGFDVVIIETVGVGQSEIAVKSLVDLMVLLVLTGTGDELQGIKRGITEQADLIVVNKADQYDDLLIKKTIQVLKGAIHHFTLNDKNITVDVMSCSSSTGVDVDKVADRITDVLNEASQNGQLEKWRKTQAVALMHRILQDKILEISLNKLNNKDLSEMENAIQNGLQPNQAAEELIQKIFKVT